MIFFQPLTEVICPSFSDARTINTGLHYYFLGVVVHSQPLVVIRDLLSLKIALSCYKNNKNVFIGLSQKELKANLRKRQRCRL